MSPPRVLVVDDDERLRALRDLPDAMRAVLARRESIGAAAQAHAPFRRYWAVVGNGPNRIAAHEVRIKLSELCYKSISFDATEDELKQAHERAMGTASIAANGPTGQALPPQRSSGPVPGECGAITLLLQNFG